MLHESRAFQSKTPELWAASAHYIFVRQGCGCLPAKCVGPVRCVNVDECWRPVNCHSAHLPAYWDSSGFFFFFFRAQLLFTACSPHTPLPWCILTFTVEAACSVLIRGKSSHALSCRCGCDEQMGQGVTNSQKHPEVKFGFFSCLEAHWMRIALTLKCMWLVVQNTSSHLLPPPPARPLCHLAAPFRACQPGYISPIWLLTLCSW